MTPENFVDMLTLVYHTEETLVGSWTEYCEFIVDDARCYYRVIKPFMLGNVLFKSGDSFNISSDSSARAPFVLKHDS